MRSVFNGSLNFGPISISVKFYSATEDHELTSHQVHQHDGGKIGYRKVCTVCEETVAAADIAKQFEVDGQVAILTEDDLSTLSSAGDRGVEVLQFVPANAIDPMMLDKPYYLAPDKSAKAYGLLAATLGDERVAIVRFTMRGKTRLAAVKVTGKGDTLIAHTLRWADEVREFSVDKPQEPAEAELELAVKLMETMTSETFNPDAYRDSYREELRELVTSKLSDAPEAVEEVSDLLAKLEASVAERSEKVAVPVVAEKADKPNIRQWARANGHTVGERGRIPKDVVDRFEREAVPA